MIEIEIHASNMNYNLTKLTVNSSNNSKINKILFNKKITIDTPEYLRYCLKLIENDVNLAMFDRKYKTFDDLNIVSCKVLIV